MKKLLLAVFSLITLTTQAQVKVGNNPTTINASAALEVESTDKGALFPRMTQAQRTAISAPATGLLVYQTDAVSGFWYYTGTSWQSLVSNTSKPDFVHAGFTVIQSNVAAGTDIKPDFIVAQNNIPYNSSTGEFSLSAGKNYELDATMTFTTFTLTNGYIVYEWVDATTNASLAGYSYGLVVPYSTLSSDGGLPTAKIIYTPVTNQTVKLRVTGSSGSAAANIASRLIIREIH